MAEHLAKHRNMMSNLSVVLDAIGNSCSSKGGLTYEGIVVLVTPWEV